MAYFSSIKWPTFRLTKTLAEGQTLLTSADALITAQVGELGEQKNATEVKDEAWAAADKVYMRHLKAARLCIHKSGDRTLLALDGERKDDYLGWHGQADRFYTQALARPDLLAQLADLNLTAAKLQAGLDMVTALETARDDAAEPDRLEAERHRRARQSAKRSPRLAEQVPGRGRTGAGG